MSKNNPSKHRIWVEEDGRFCEEYCAYPDVGVCDWVVGACCDRLWPRSQDVGEQVFELRDGGAGYEGGGTQVECGGEYLKDLVFGDNSEGDTVQVSGGGRNMQV